MRSTVKKPRSMVTSLARSRGSDDMSGETDYQSARSELERTLTGDKALMSSVLEHGSEHRFFLLPQGGVLEYVRYGKHGLQPGSEEAIIRIYNLDGAVVATFVKGMEPWHIFAMKLPAPLYDAEIYALRDRPNFIRQPNWTPKSIVSSGVSASRHP